MTGARDPEAHETRSLFLVSAYHLPSCVRRAQQKMEVSMDLDTAKEDAVKDVVQDEEEDDDDDDEEGMGVKAKALTKLLKTSSV